FSQYASEALCASLLPKVPDPDEARVLSPSEIQLSPRQYERYFRFHLEAEISHQEQENASYSLYGHEGVMKLLSDKQAEVTIEVPGLREYSPYVEDDDLVQLRQIRYDGATGLIPSVNTAFYSPYPPPFYPSGPWTEIIYNARVSAVLRPVEKLVLRVDGMTLQGTEVLLNHPPNQPLTSEHKLKLNIQFPVPRERYYPMEHVLPQIQASLSQALNATYREDPVEDEEGSSRGSSASEYWIQSMLFPTEADCDVQADMQLGLFARPSFDSALNIEQRVAVENICSQNYGVVPYLISGPPGTGKTKTLIETALQLINNVDNVSHILICAPSDPASDTLADRLRPLLKPHELLRLNRPTRGFTEVADALLPYCYVSNDMFSLPPFHQLMAYKIVVTSCRDASLLMYTRVTNSDLYTVQQNLHRTIHPTDRAPSSKARLHWNALLIDEAAQSTEPESLVPLYVVAPPSESHSLLFTPLVVMAGDEHQLTPRTSSPHTPLKRSLFARLFARPVYADHPLARRLNKSNPNLPPSPPPTLQAAMLPILRPAFTNLVSNYRSHPAILAVPSHLFYHDTLLPAAHPPSANRLASWSGWRGRRGWPVLYHNNPSPDELEADNGGWYNPGEAVLACTYARRLVDSGLVGAEEVCIMSPFKAQVRRLRKLARSGKYGDLWGVNIGPTEAFQGLEHGVVVLCVTRARRRFVRRDLELGWGVVGGGGEMESKMNVALTRARFGLVVVG
ncbi:P-loop containing nucleoside triphosphate hydrolase protein, partial [Bombardia bombarda]